MFFQSIIVMCPLTNINFVLFRRQKEKRINPACMSPNGSNGSDGTAAEYTKNLFTASLSSLPTSSTASSVSSAQFHPLALVGGFNTSSLGLTPNETRG